MLLPPVDLERICKGTATLDAMISAEWEYRYYSFNRAWAPGQRMASMRNGAGDDWFIVFDVAGVFVKAFWHEYPHEDVARIYGGLPQALVRQATEPAFSMDAVTFGGWHDGAAWTLRGNPIPMIEELEILTGDPEPYRVYAAERFEVTVPLDAIAHVLAGKPLDAELVRKITVERSLDDLAADLAEIGYGIVER